MDQIQSNTEKYKVRVNNKLIDLSELLRICNEHCHECLFFDKIVDDSRKVEKTQRVRKKK